MRRFCSYCCFIHFLFLILKIQRKHLKHFFLKKTYVSRSKGATIRWRAYFTLCKEACMEARWLIYTLSLSGIFVLHSSVHVNPRPDQALIEVEGKNKYYLIPWLWLMGKNYGTLTGKLTKKRRDFQAPKQSKVIVKTNFL